MPEKPKPFKPMPQRRPRERRASASARGYGRSWQKASKAYLMAHPLCECQECQDEQRILSAEVVDHIIPHKGNMVLFWDESNWCAMNGRCHNRKTAKEDGGFGRKAT